MKVNEIRFAIQLKSGGYHYDTYHGASVPFDTHAKAAYTIELGRGGLLYRSQSVDFTDAKVVPVTLVAVGTAGK